MFLNCTTAEDTLKSIKDKNVQMIDLRFTDLPGTWQHFSVPPSAVDADAMSEGIGFDGSSIRGFQEIQESDMLVVPDATTAFLDPFTSGTTLVLICNIRDPVPAKPIAAMPATLRRRPRRISNGSALPIRSISGLRRVLRLQRGALRSGHQLRLPRDRFKGRYLEFRQTGGPEPRPRAAPKRATFQFFPSTVCRIAHRDGTDDAVIGISRSKPITMRWEQPAKRKSTCGLRRYTHRRQLDALQVRDQNIARSMV